METHEQLQSRLHSLEELRTIVKTMKALSAASIRQYERAAHAVGGYYETVERGLQVVLRDAPATTTAHQSGAGSGALGVVVFGSDHGLCGRFNEEIVQHALDRLGAAEHRPGDWRLLAVGARAAAALEHADGPVDEAFAVPGSADQITATVQRILVTLEQWRTHAGVGPVRLFYNRHGGSKGYEPTGAVLLPIELGRFRRLREQPWPSRSIPTFSMPHALLLQRLVRQYLFVSIFRACAESQASEHASRLAAMQAAQRNLDERLDEVTMTYRRARQNTITSELLDVVAGFEAITASG